MKKLLFCLFVGVSLATLAGYTGPVCRYAAGEGAIDDGRPSVRWRGFNLLEMFIKGGKDEKPREFRESDFRMIRDWGFNFVRLPMDYRFWIVGDDWEKIDESSVAYIDRAIALGRKYGVHVQVCMHRCPGYTVAQPRERKDLFTDPDAQRVCALHWSYFAKRWKGIPNAELSFNLFNEPPSTTEEAYAKVAKILIDAIRAEDPTRFIMADGLSYGNQPLPQLFGMPGVGQSTRGYAPMSISHYMASWVGTPTAKPVWPLSSDAPAGILTGSGKPDLRGKLEILDVPPCKVSVSYGRVSGRVTVRFSADSAVVQESTFDPQKDSPEWKNVKFHPEWGISQGSYLGRTTFDLPQGAKTLTAELSAGDWIDLGAVTLTTADGRTADLKVMSEWVKPRNFRQRFVGFDKRLPFVSASADTQPHRYADEGREYLYRRQLAKWDEALSRGTFVMAGEFGVWKMTPHEMVLDVLEDYLTLWEERKMGWALWNLRGEFGVLNSNRADVEYESYEGNKLDRRLLELLQRH